MPCVFILLYSSGYSLYNRTYMLCAHTCNILISTLDDISPLQEESKYLPKSNVFISQEGISCTAVEKCSIANVFSLLRCALFSLRVVNFCHKTPFLRYNLYYEYTKSFCPKVFNFEG